MDGVVEHSPNQISTPIQKLKPLFETLFQYDKNESRLNRNGLLWKKDKLLLYESHIPPILRFIHITNIIVDIIINTSFQEDYNYEGSWIKL